MRFKILLMAVVLTGLLFTLSASAAITTESCGVVPIQQLTYTTTTQIDKFDENLGELQSVTITARACGYLDNWLESNDQSEITYNIIATGQIIPTIPSVPEEALQIGTGAGGINFDAIPDGNPNDRTGTDYIAFDVGSASTPECTDKLYFLTGADMAPYKAVGGGSVQIPVRTKSSLFVDGSNNYESGGQTFMGVEICVEYEYLAPSCINGTKTNDCTGDPIPGWEICLSNSSGQIACIETDANGDYSFCGLTPGNYQVTEETREGWVSMDATVKDVALVDDNVDGVDFLNAPLTCISGHKFNSKTNAGLSGWTIQLKDANGAMIRETTTGTGGFYQFCGLAPGRYTVCEVLKAQWKAVSPICIDVELVECDNSEDNDFFNEPSNLVCVCPFFIKNELYNANCNAIYEVDASKGILANDPPGSIVLNPESITIDPKYGTITVEEDGSFVYDPTGATALHTGVYVIFKYAANNGFCDSKYLGVAKIQVSCK